MATKSDNTEVKVEDVSVPQEVAQPTRFAVATPKKYRMNFKERKLKVINEIADKGKANQMLGRLFNR